jgi:hypothetical protein
LVPIGGFDLILFHVLFFPFARIPSSCGRGQSSREEEEEEGGERTNLWAVARFLSLKALASSISPEEERGRDEAIRGGGNGRTHQAHQHRGDSWRHLSLFRYAPAAPQ